MLVFEFKAYGNKSQFTAVDEAIRTAQFVRNSCLRYWTENKKIDKYDLNKYCAVLASEFPFADALNSQARQASAERAWSAISRFYENCKKGISGKKGYPQFQKNCRSVEYKSTGWKLATDRKSIKFTDKKGIGKLKLKGTRDLHFYSCSQIKRVRLVKRASGVYVQFCIDVDRCKCGCLMNRDFNAARNILSRGLGTVGHTGTFALNASNALGDESSTFAGEILHQQVMS
ncbi:hypothetical protein [Microcoleus sp. CAWBG640]|uniref:RNA-guided endonuclease InsQ/TnpB family protein n=1 Tax=Microcoleus sp. CAWBG640 TaxID=2841653 RepID=UPI00312BBB0F